MCPTENQLVKFLKSWLSDSSAKMTGTEFGVIQRTVFGIVCLFVPAPHVNKNCNDKTWSIALNSAARSYTG